MRFGIPRYRLPREVLDAEIQRLVELGVKIELNRRVTRILDAMREGGFDAAFLAVGAHLGKRAYIPAGRPPRCSTPSRSSGAWRGRIRHCSAAGLSSTGRKHGDGRSGTAKRLGAEEAIVVYRRRGSRMPAHEFEVEEAEQEGVLMKWLSTVKQADGGKLVIERMELDETASRSRRASSRSWRPTRSCSRSGRRPISSCSRACPVSASTDGVLTVGPNMMSGHPGIFAGGDMVPAERTVTVAVGHGKKAARHIDAWLRGEEDAVRRSASSPPSAQLNTWYYSDAPRTVQPQLELARRQSTFDEVVGGLDGVQRAVRGPSLSLLRQLLLVRQLLRRLSRQRGDQARRPGRAVRDRLRLLQGLRNLCRRVPVRRDRDGSRGDLISYSRFSAPAGPLKKAPGRLVTTSRGSTAICSALAVVLSWRRRARWSAWVAARANRPSPSLLVNTCFRTSDPAYFGCTAARGVRALARKEVSHVESFAPAR